MRPILGKLILLGAVTGFLSGTFVIGGGVLLVPLLVMVLRYSQPLAAGTSVAVIFPTGVVGGIGYAVQGHVDWWAAAGLAIGVVVGAQIGSFLLARLRMVVLRWFFIVFLVFVAVTLWFVVPARDAVIELDALGWVLLIGVGLAVGILSGLLGVGGGVVVVPALMLIFGASDLVAKGTSLLVLIPGSLSGTIGNLRRGNVNLRVALVIGLVSSICSPIGSDRKSTRLNSSHVAISYAVF